MDLILLRNIVCKYNHCAEIIKKDWCRWDIWTQRCCVNIMWKWLQKLEGHNYNSGMPKIVRYHLVFITFLITVTKYMKQFKMWRNDLVHKFRGNLIGHQSKNGFVLLSQRILRRLKTLSEKIIKYNFLRIDSNDPVLQLGSTSGSFHNIHKSSNQLELEWPHWTLRHFILKL